MLCMLLSLISNESLAAGSAPAAEQAAAMLDALAPADGPGIQYVLVDENGVVYQKTAGLADIQGKAPLTGDHLMAAFSMTKTITAIAVLQLHEKGRLALDDKVSRYFQHPYHPETTIRQLLNHTSGIPNPIPLRWVHLSSDEGAFDEQAALVKVLNEHPRARRNAGEAYEYSNIGYWLLGKVVEAASGQEYTSYVKERLFQPLGLKPTEIGFAITPPALRAKGYLAKYSFMNLLKGFVTDRAVWGGYEGDWLHIKDVSVNGPSFGGVFGTARAFGRILRDLLSDGSILLGNAGKELLFGQEKTNSGEPIAMTLGFHISDLHGGRYFFKEGGGAGFHAEMRIYPSSGLASVIMTNRTSFESRKRLTDVDELFLLYYKDRSFNAEKI